MLTTLDYEAGLSLCVCVCLEGTSFGVMVMEAIQFLIYSFYRLFASTSLKLVLYLYVLPRCLLQ